MQRFIIAFFTCIILSLATVSLYAQTAAPDRPKLVVGIVVDQMRQEYLYRFYEKFGEAGFRRLMNDGFMLRNAHYNYAPTVTGPGHASVYTGSTPAIHGIIGNDFYDKQAKQYVNCVQDPLQKPVGNDAGNGDVSPWRMLSSTVTDELKLFTQKRAKVIGVSMKDRGASLPAGHMADAAYWYDSQSGKFITSTYYMSKLPDWLVKFNGQNLANQYLNQEWKTLYPIEQYTESGPDSSPYERKMNGKDRSVFPYALSQLRGKNNNFELLPYTPFANDYLTEMAKTAVLNEQMGKHEVTDFLCISYSTTDLVGHMMGPNAVEVEDIYLRLDRNIDDLLKNLDKQVGAGNYTVFLTADHAVADVPQYMKDSKMPAGYFNESYVKAKLNEFLATYYPGRDFIENISNEQIFLNQAAFQRDPKTSGIDMIIVTELIGKYLMTVDGVANYYTESQLRQANYDEGGVKGMFIRGFHPKRSGDILIALEPGWFESASVQGTTHGSPYKYDTHVPALFYGYGVKKGTSYHYHPITDIAPTISALLKIKYPSGSTGQPIVEIFE
ncbi:alkaline phosphatase PafA [Chryseolinea lacunae]|uniref:Alkaline phosphatase family protein n=1 Tax=Chryseolinea lacunae TaxID=2801331 RepID=A0ABS1KLK4_9BACT|nr:alkaline phosphatase PafA [Chryseolinea lacunae]MBL0740225.1 alkaline phosphatase family protein [Chryseolinea lacunae]